MHRYQSYFAEDFVFDADFQRWVRFSDSQQDIFWKQFIDENSAKRIEIETARTVLLSVYTSGQTPISDHEVRQVISGLMARIRADQAQVHALIASDAEPKVYSFRYWLSVAAVLVLCVTGVWYSLRTGSEVKTVAKTETESFLLKENNGSADQTFQLEDGSTVVLAAGSSLKIPVRFNSGVRQVSLVGRAMFKVAKNPERPFIVFSDQLVTRVLGTTFTVNSSKGENESFVEVVEGRVSVYRRQDFSLAAEDAGNPSKGIMLTANQKVIYRGQEGLMTRALAEKPSPVITGKALPAFIYRNAPVIDVLQDIEQAYQVDIVFDTEQLTDCSVTASLSNQSLLTKIEIICEAIEARFEVLDGQIVIYGKKCQN